MKWLDDIKKKFDEDPISLVIWAILAILMFATLAGRLDWWNSKLSGVIEQATHAEGNKVMVPGWLLFILDIVFFSVPILAMLLVRSEINRVRAVRARSEPSTIAHRTMLGMMRAATKLRHRSFPDNPSQTKSHVSIENTYLIHKDFTTEVTRGYELKATTAPIHFCEIAIGVNSQADPADYLDNIDFKVHSHDDKNEIVYLPIENDGFRKKVVLYFLPRIEANDPKPRSFTVTYKWPKMLAQMSEIGGEEFTWKFNSVEAIGMIKMSFFLEPGTGKNLAGELAGPNYPGAKIEKASHDDWPGFVYEVKNVPAGLTDHAVRLILREP